MALLLIAAMAATAQEPMQDSTPAYLLSVLLGFGTGHFYLHVGDGMRFLLLEAGALTVAGVGLMLGFPHSSGPSSLGFSPRYIAGLGITVFGALAYSGFRIWEIVDVISTVKALRAAGRVTMRPSVALCLTAEAQPGVKPRRPGVLIGARLSY